MWHIPATEFEQLVSQAVNDLPEPFKGTMSNVAFVIEDLPNEQQRQKLRLTRHQSLFGLYEGIPLTQRGAGYNMVLPDKITIFQMVIEQSVDNLADLQAQVKQTVWHEIAHHFGLGHGRIEELQRKRAEA